MKRSVSSLMIAAAVACVTQMPAHATVTVEGSVTVDASPEIVWQALGEYQKEEKAFHKKIVSTHQSTVTIKEEFAKLPIVGAAHINYVEIGNSDHNRIDYKLTDSSVLNRFDGAWIVEDNKAGGVNLKIVTNIDTWVPAPFKNKLLRNNTKKGMEKRLAFVKQYAEHLAASHQVNGVKVSIKND